jgi:hypothetical protein
MVQYIGEDDIERLEDNIKLLSIKYEFLKAYLV